MRVTIDDAESRELHAAVLDRHTFLEKKKKEAAEHGLPDHEALYAKTLRLYTGEGDNPGLLNLFKEDDGQTDAFREQRNAEGQQDAFGGGAETGGRKRTNADGGVTWAKRVPKPRPVAGENVVLLAGGVGVITVALGYLGTRPIQTADGTVDAPIFSVLDAENTKRFARAINGLWYEVSAVDAAENANDAVVTPIPRKLKQLAAGEVAGEIVPAQA